MLMEITLLELAPVLICLGYCVIAGIQNHWKHWLPKKNTRKYDRVWFELP